MSFFKVLVFLGAFDVQISALKARSRLTKTSNCETVEWEANTSEMPCWLRGDCPDEPRKEKTGTHGQKTNVRGNIEYHGEHMMPESVEELVAIVKQTKKIIMVGTGCSVGMTTAPVHADATVVTMWKFRHVRLDTCKLTITVGAGVASIDVAPTLAQHGLTMPSWLAKKDFNFVGITSNNVIGMGMGQITVGLSQMVLGVEVVNGKGEVKSYQGRSDPHLQAWQMGLGELGAIYTLTMRVEPDQYNVQSCSNYISYDEMIGVLDLENPVFPGLGGQFNDANGGNAALAITEGCGSLARTYVRDGLPAGYEDVCKTPVNPPLDMDPVFSRLKALKNFPAQQEMILVLANWVIRTRPDTVKANWPKLIKMFKGWPLPPHPFYPESTVSCWQYSSLGVTPLKIDLPQHAPSWTDIMIDPWNFKRVLKKVTEFRLNALKMSSQSAPSTIMSFWDRVSEGPEPRAYMAPNTRNMLRNMFIVMGAPFAQNGSPRDREALDSFFTELYCKMECEEPVVKVVSYHLGLAMPRALAESPGIEFPRIEELQKFLDIEHEEDPENIFQTVMGDAMKVRYVNLQKSGPNATFCAICPTS